MASIIGFLTTMLTFGVIACIAIAALIIPQYNKLKVLAEGITEAFANILVSMQKRADLANKLQEIASTYAKDEQFTVLAIGEDSVSGIVDSYRDSLQAVSVVQASAQRFPQLKADVLYQSLMQELSGLESELQQKREAFNACVRYYNSPLKQFPTVLYATTLGLFEAPYWQSDDPESLKRLKEFKTDDTRVRELVSKAGNRAAGITRLGVAAVKSRMERSPASVEQKEQAASEREMETLPPLTTHEP